MNGKKKYLIVALLLLLGFGAVSFAGGNEDELEPVGGNNSQVEDKNGTQEPNRVDDVVLDEEDDDTELVDDITEPTTTVQNSNANTGSNRPTQNNTANEPQVDASLLVSNTEKMVYDAVSKENVDDAKGYFDTNEIKEVVSNLEQGTEKENLQERVEELEKVFADNAAPTIGGVDPNTATKENVSLTITDDLEYKTTVLLNDEEVEYKDTFDKEGTYTVSVTDKAQNTNSINFTIDKTAPKLNEVKSGNHYTDITVDVVDETDVKISIQKDHKDIFEVENGASLTEEGTYKITLIDAAGNKSVIWTAIDNVKPTITGVTNNSVVNTCDRIYVQDRYLNEVKINDEVYTRDDFTHNAYNEDFKFEKRVCADGTYTITAKDKIGNTYSETFTIDRSEPTLNYSTLRLNGSVYNETIDKVTHYYVTNGDVIEYAVAFNEKLLNAPKVTIGGKEVTMKLNPKETYRDEKRIYLYEGKVTFTKEDNIPNGKLDIVLSDVYDLAGNASTDEKVLKPVHTTNYKVLVYDSELPKVNYVVVLSKKDNYDKAIKGDTIRWLVQFNEEIIIPENKEERTFVVKVDGKEVKFVRSQGNGYEYIAEYTIPENTSLKTGDLEFEITGFKDKAGNTAESITKGKHNKYNNVYFDAIAPTISLVGTQGANKNEHRIIEGSRVYLDYVLATVTDNSLDKPIEIKPISVRRYYPSETGKASHVYKYEEEYTYKKDGKNYILDENGNKIIDKTYYYFDTENVGEEYHLEFEYTDDSGYTAKKTMILAIDAYKNPVADENGIIEVTKDVNNGYIPFYNVIDNEKPITINGNNHTVTQVINEDAFYWNATGNRSMLGNIFSSTKGAKITVNDLTFKGTTGSISLGHYVNSSSNWYNTELNNVNIVGLNVVSFSAGISPGVAIYGKAQLNNVNIYDTKLSSLDTNPAWPVYDLALVNYSNTKVENSKIGSVYTWEQATMTVKNSEVDYIYTKMWNNKGGLVIDEGSKVKNITVANNIAASTSKHVLITVKAGATVDTIDLSKTNYSAEQIKINIEEGATVKNIINK